MNKTGLTHAPQLQRKAQEFSLAIKKYESNPYYVYFEHSLALLIVLLQLIGLLYLSGLAFQSVWGILLTLIFSYFLSDFFNGLVHMIVDNNTAYASAMGPFIAAFHLHHFKGRYQVKHPLKIYFVESGHKFWLAIYLVILTWLQAYLRDYPYLILGLVSFAIFSSLAEVSHYWCHHPEKSAKLIKQLQKYRILLSLKHHRIHHIQDNRNYAFLNGMSDPILNIIAKFFYKGYQNYSDKHVAFYMRQALNAEKN